MKPPILLVSAIRRIYLVVVLLSAGCHQEEKPPTPAIRYRISKTVQTAFNFEQTTTYQYDGQNRLVAVREYPSIADTLANVTPTTVSTVNYQASAPARFDFTNQRLTKPAYTNGKLLYGLRRTFNYDSQGRIAVVTESNALDDFKNFQLFQTFQYEYGADNLPTTLIITGAAPLLERNVYGYTFENGNAAHVKLAITNSRSSVPTLLEYDVRFDEAPGIYFNFFAIYPGVTSFNKNNVINTNTTHYQDERGLLIKRVRKGNYIDEVTEYTYETY
ncbi:hypothetical protein [Spirosoma sp. KNUC1025]|uniref:hypothetical protein n=1 Tax=Spirosoma sp. KNUC1025 TaxID=2894082 RepID=UPI003863DEFB|nr:hypothetical protein LN737_29145 [Spirosoma sp. KNUC1025]